MADGTRAALVAALLAVTAGGAAADEAAFPELPGDGLAAGRTVWLGTCRNCHATGFADAPPVTRFDLWQPRLAQPRTLLYTHALEGFYGADYAHMPPRGGNPALTDDEVRRAVDYMAALVRHLNEEKDDDPGTD